MRVSTVIAGAVLLGVILAGCGPSAETPRASSMPDPATKEGIYTRAQQYWFDNAVDSAAALFARAATMDSLYLDPVRDLAHLHYEQGMRAPENSRERKSHLGASRTQYERLAARGVKEADVYDRLCELSVALGNKKGFARWAKANAEAFPYDRQYYNLCRAYFDLEDFQSVIQTAKQCIEKFSASPYISSFYRILGRSYMRVDRDQTAERILTSGLKVTNTRLAALRKEGREAENEDALRRAKDDKINMLLLLKQLHTTYKADDKLKVVERQLKEEGYDR